MKMKKSKQFVSLLTLVASGCATADDWDSAVAGGQFCGKLSEFASTVPSGEQRHVEFVIGGEWLVNSYKNCDPVDDAASARFCEWLIENTSTEYMEANINIALSCLQGQAIRGNIGNTGVEYWQGKAVFYRPNLSVENVSVTIEYELGYFDKKVDEQRMKITVDAE